MRRSLFALLSVLGVLAVAPVAGLPVPAPTSVTWGPVTLITSNLDIVNPGSVVEARNYGGTFVPPIVPVDVGGTPVEFVRFGPAATAPNFPGPEFCYSFGAGGFFDPSGTGVGGDFLTVLNAISYARLDTACNRAVATETFTGLTPG